jgi:Ca2+-transporting ATPase
MDMDDSELTGLSEAAAVERLRAEGPNALPDPDRKGFWKIIVEVLREPMFALLLVGGAVYLALGELKESLVLLAFATLSVSIAVVQEFRSERVLESLRDLTSPVSVVIREGRRRRIPSRELVRGDLIAVAEGERVPADAVLRLGDEVEADESLLTGESVPVRKAPSSEARSAGAPGSEETFSLYSGSLIVRSQGLAEVTATGPRSELGKIGGALGHIELEPTRLTLETRRIVRAVGAAGFVACAIVVVLTGLLSGSWLKGVLGGVALGMAMLPEEFPLVLTVFMVMGAWRIGRAGVLTRRASAIETLGSATVLCTDKTGTLTQNRMAVLAAWNGGRLYEWQAGQSAPAGVGGLTGAGAMASSPHPFDPMERAFHEAAPDPFEGVHDWRLERAFGVTSQRLAVVQVWTSNATGERLAAAKGAPETVLRLCRVQNADSDGVLAAVDAMASRGMRVLGVAIARRLDSMPADPEELTFEFLGLAGLADPLRPDAAAAVAECRSAGVRVVMVTGDYPATARAIAAEAGVSDGETLTGQELAELSDEALAARIRSVTVFARILPEQKLRIVQALKAAGEVVAMTGDGVNDAPALKAADIGVAMGQRGTDVAREASSLVLMNDDFGSIVATVRLGRRIYDNLQKAMGFILAVHVPIAGLTLLPLVLGMPALLAPAHIALLEMIIDPACSIVFEAEPEEGDLMKRPPRDPKAPLFGRRRIGAGLLQGLAVMIVVGAVYALSERWGLDPATVRTTAFLALVISFLALVQTNRGFKAGIESLGHSNVAFVWTAAAVAAALSAIVMVPWLRDLFQFEPVDARDVAVALGAGVASFILLELIKRLSSRTRPA